MIDRKKYTEKCINLLHTGSFIRLDHDPTKTTEGKIQRSIRKIKNNLTKQEYSGLYPTGSSPGKFFATAKQHYGITSFLDVLLMRNNGKSETTAFRKETNNNIYLHWRSFAPITWKKGTLRTLFRSTYTVYSNNNLLQEKLQHIEKYFTEINGYPKSLLKQTLDSFKTSSKEYNNKINNKNNNDINVNNLSDKIVHNLILPYQGDHDTNSKNSIKLSTKKSLPENLDVRII